MSVRFEFLPPSPALAHLIRQHQIIRLSFAASDCVPLKPYWPRPSSSLAFYSRDPEWIRHLGATQSRRKPRAVLIGQPTRTTLREGGRDFSVYQIEFQPGALYALTGLALSELTDGDIDAEAVFPPDFASLIREVEDTEDSGRRISASEAWLQRHDQRRQRPMAAADAIAVRLLQHPSMEIDRLARRHDIGARQLRRAFHERIGVSPKLFARIARFDTLVRLSNRHPAHDWLSLAIEAGYYDYHHLRRDFREFCDMAPNDFRTVEAASPERKFGFRED
ncbi:bacterial regulatory helix-turn-helix protein, AraC family protein [Asticcacaulis biprosthecium C19]|uniref:Bacterial regulatory helix-turn-helix protein, AraC family protein n=1 Tax=Asticcacaulis biprosthecium C19 TaxID=715226 RepID=F4QMQ2_9CAUL|nr:helix-turn-helix domain-containing protein [Asticcacaulis biprosthecium]EGF91493.1 bacterial regulatory helix-turn-helix protein, AraC family protein [Asticcacaulis biprosthecium C19]